MDSGFVNPPRAMLLDYERVVDPRFLFFTHAYVQFDAGELLSISTWKYQQGAQPLALMSPEPS